MFRAGAPDPVQSLICLLKSLLKPFPRPVLKSGVVPLARYGKHQEIINRRQMYTSSDTRLERLGEGPLFESYSNKRRGQNGAAIRVTSEAIIKVRPAALGQI